MGLSASNKKPKVLLFDIGGVCVVSPFQAILDYELGHGIPPGWINYAISRTGPDGFWHRLERGEIPLDAAFIAGFGRDLHSPALWLAFCREQEQKQEPKQEQKQLRGPQEQINDEGIPSLPSEQEASSQQPPPALPIPSIDAGALFGAMTAVSRIPDPWMFPALQRLRQLNDGGGKRSIILAALSNTVILNRAAAADDNNNNNNDHNHDSPVRGLFDVFVSSAHVGLRKPDPRIYELALRMVNDFAAGAAAGTATTRGKDIEVDDGRPKAREGGGREEEEEEKGSGGGGDAIKPEHVLFLDDIGENLKAAKKLGFRTLKVRLGRAYEAVDELERITGLALAGDHPRGPLGPGYRPRVLSSPGAKPKI